MTYNPPVDVSKDTTTLQASDRGVFLIPCGDLNPIGAGRLPDGEPDLCFGGFSCWTLQAGWSCRLGTSSFHLRAVPRHPRDRWGVEEFEQVTIRHARQAAHGILANSRTGRSLDDQSRLEGALLAVVL